MERNCNKKRWLSRKLENSSRSPFSSSCSPSSSAKISGGCCQEYFVAEETSLVRASLREDRDTLSGFNGQCPLRRKFRGTLVPKFAGSQGARHRGLVPLGYRPLSAKYRSGHVSNPEEHVSLMQPRRQFQMPLFSGCQVAKPQGRDAICEVETRKRGCCCLKSC